jgi:hypothetical protein
MADAGIPIAVIYELPHIPYELRNRLRPKYDGLCPPFHTPSPPLTLVHN